MNCCNNKVLKKCKRKDGKIFALKKIYKKTMYEQKHKRILSILRTI